MIDFLKNLRLSLVEWLCVAGAAVIGGLVVALRVQGSRLHRAHLELLETKFDTRNAQANKDAEQAGKDYSKALQEYYDAGGKL